MEWLLYVLAYLVIGLIGMKIVFSFCDEENRKLPVIGFIFNLAFWPIIGFLGGMLLLAEWAHTKEIKL